MGHFGEQRGSGAWTSSTRPEIPCRDPARSKPEQLLRPRAALKHLQRQTSAASLNEQPTTVADQPHRRSLPTFKGDFLHTAALLPVSAFMWLGLHSAQFSRNLHALRIDPNPALPSLSTPAPAASRTHVTPNCSLLTALIALCREPPGGAPPPPLSMKQLLTASLFLRSTKHRTAHVAVVVGYYTLCTASCDPHKKKAAVLHLSSSHKNKGATAVQALFFRWRHPPPIPISAF